MPRWYFEDFTPGFTLELDGPTVKAEDIIEFAKKYDPQFFHVDAEAAKSSFFGGLCASGWHTSAMCMRMMCDSYLLDSASLGSPGIDELRWTKPVFAGDTLKLKMTVLEQRPSKSRPEMGSVLSTWEVFNQKGERVMHMKGWGMFGKRTPGPARAE
ncbi:MAG: MaoC family dehydratase [Myxococcaceae bacterium]